jgi:hypothetical protein
VSPVTDARNDVDGMFVNTSAAMFARRQRTGVGKCPFETTSVPIE